MLGQVTVHSQVWFTPVGTRHVLPAPLSIMIKLSRLKTGLKNWNITVFGNLKVLVSNSQAQLEQAHNQSNYYTESDFLLTDAKIKEEHQEDLLAINHKILK